MHLSCTMMLHLQSHLAIHNIINNVLKTAAGKNLRSENEQIERNRKLSTPFRNRGSVGHIIVLLVQFRLQFLEHGISVGKIAFFSTFAF